MDRTAVYQIEVSGMNAEVVIDTTDGGADIIVSIGGKKLTESSLGPAEMEALRRFFIE
jgi:hypothetical protein